MRVLGSDLDGTFGYNGVDDVKRNAVSRWRSAGNIFAIVSGRPVDRILNYAKQFSFACDYLVAHNGAVIAKGDGEIISQARCDGSMVVPLIELLLQNGCAYVKVGMDSTYAVYADAAENELKGGYNLQNLPEFPWFTQINTKFADFETAEKVTRIIREQMGNALNPLQNDVWIDIVRQDINKAKGIYLLMDLVGAQYEDVIVVGDNVNDFDMIKEFKSYAMESGVDTIKALADYTTPGVAELIERELSGER